MQLATAPTLFTPGKSAINRCNGFLAACTYHALQASGSTPATVLTQQVDFIGHALLAYLEMLYNFGEIFHVSSAQTITILIHLNSIIAACNNSPRVKYS